MYASMSDSNLCSSDCAKSTCARQRCLKLEKVPVAAWRRVRPLLPARASALCKRVFPEQPSGRGTTAAGNRYCR